MNSNKRTPLLSGHISGPSHLFSLINIIVTPIEGIPLIDKHLREGVHLIGVRLYRVVKLFCLMKIVQGLTFKFNHVIDISHFQAVQVLQVRIIKIVVLLG